MSNMKPSILQLALSAFPITLGGRSMAFMDASSFAQPTSTKNRGNTLSQKGKRKRVRQMIGRGRS